MNINGIELNFDMSNADTIEKFTAAMEEAGVANAAINKEMTVPEMARHTCTIVKNAFDQVFGDGIGLSVCGEAPSMNVHIDALNELVNESVRQKNEFTEKYEKLSAKFQLVPGGAEASKE